MRTLGIDIETFSDVDIKKSGSYPYIESPAFDILLFSYAFDDEPVTCIDLTAGEHIPDEVVLALTDPGIRKAAHNAQFERTCLSRYLGIYLDPGQWECTMVKASMLGLPLALEVVAKVLKLPQEKLTTGKALIRFFCVPCKPSKANGQRTRNMPQDHPEKWTEFKSYNIQDVVVERSIRNKIAFFSVPAGERTLYSLDQKINDRGILLDPVFISNAIKIDADYRQKLTEEAIRLTGLENPNSVKQLSNWLSQETGIVVSSLKKDNIESLKNHPFTHDCDNRKAVERLLEIRQELSKTSVKKYITMMKAICGDNRFRGLVQFYGANRTGRWAGRLVQVHNLPRKKLKDATIARDIVKAGDGDLLEMLYGNVPDTLSCLIRTAFIAPAGNQLWVSDFRAIEARVLAWLAGERWRMEVFRTHGKIYESSASQMFKIPMEKITDDIRQRGKVSELALGYQGAVGALLTMGALEMGLEEDELPKLVKMWRNANKSIVNYWYEVGNAAIECVETGMPVPLSHGIRFFMEKGVMFIQLPSGRCLSYMRPQIDNSGDWPKLSYEGMNQETKQWQRIDTYGGKLVENIVQAVARDCLADAMVRVDKAGHDIIMHVHDEMVGETTEEDTLDKVIKIMSEPISWASGLPLDAAGFVTPYYKKD